jgi:hypothetical protein
MTHFKYTIPKLSNRPEIQWADWLEYGHYTVHALEMVPVNKIEYDEWKPAKTDALVEKIKAGTAIDPAVLDFVDGKYKVTDGNHRTVASIRLGFTHVPAVVSRLVDKEPDFPAPAELAKELLGRECLFFIQWLRNDAHRDVVYHWKLADRRGYQILVEVEHDAIGKEDKYVLLVLANGDDRKLEMFQAGNRLWSTRTVKEKLMDAAREVNEVVNRASRVREANRIAADDYPIGLDEKRKHRVDDLRNAVVEKKIYNVPYQEAKRSLTSQLEQATSHGRVPRRVWSLAYRLDSFGDNFRVLPKAIVTLGNAAKWDVPPEDILAKLQPADAESIRSDWKGTKRDLLDYISMLKSWLPIKDLLEEAKGYIIKGREPSGNPPARYVPGAPTAQVVAFVKKELEALAAPLVPKLVEARTEELVRRVEEIAEKMPGVMQAHPEWQWRQSQAVKSIAGEGSAARMFMSVWNDGELKPDYKAVVHRLVELDVKAMAESFVAKNTGKLAPIVSRKGNLKGAKVLHGGLEGFGFWGEIRFEFEDGTEFTVRNKMVVKWSPGTGSFAQYPTTFHQVKLSDGTVKAMQSEEQMNEEWAIAGRREASDFFATSDRYLGSRRNATEIRFLGMDKDSYAASGRVRFKIGDAIWRYDMSAESAETTYKIVRHSVGRALAYAKKMKWKEMRENPVKVEARLTAKLERESRIASKVAGMLPGMQYDPNDMEQRAMPYPDGFVSEELDNSPYSEVTHCQCSGTPQ